MSSAPRELTSGEEGQGQFHLLVLDPVLRKWWQIPPHPSMSAQSGMFPEETEATSPLSLCPPMGLLLGLGCKGQSYQMAQDREQRAQVSADSFDKGGSWPDKSALKGVDMAGSQHPLAGSEAQHAPWTWT